MLSKEQLDQIIDSMVAAVDARIDTKLKEYQRRRARQTQRYERQRQAEHRELIARLDESHRQSEAEITERVSKRAMANCLAGDGSKRADVDYSDEMQRLGAPGHQDGPPPQTPRDAASLEAFRECERERKRGIKPDFPAAYKRACAKRGLSEEPPRPSLVDEFRKRLRFQKQKSTDPRRERASQLAADRVLKAREQGRELDFKTEFEKLLGEEGLQP
jgi:hypothetical protein